MLVMFPNCVFSVMSGIIDVLVVVLGVSELIDNIHWLPDFSNVNAFPWTFKDSIDFCLLECICQRSSFIQRE